eukprot:CAMPEP_0197534228 /NCGR_PEP_ID=MMETSP1318-20131121/46389_1 /TAXON_ID=552666 /ORGANISM="Partenskyella glossopodia, Strain RCC365" /LENGTH=255 /DNA_ID=CAMNT_0043091417 /DNA_START=134 /DNA_END=901 /DNA_ORIENTATION=+
MQPSRIRRVRDLMSVASAAPGEPSQSLNIDLEAEKVALGSETQMHSGKFEVGFRDELEQLFLWRRDVRRFKTDPVDPKVLQKMLFHACIAPSVGNSQPWRFVMVETPQLRTKILKNFEQANNEALEGYKGERAQTYASLKLSGLTDAPVQVAVFCEKDTSTGHGLGRKSMPETLDYSVVSAIQQLWLSGRAYGVGVGWVSIIDPEYVTKELDVPSNWKLIAYLCIGYPVEEHMDPELVRFGWQERLNMDKFMHKR